MNTTENNKLIAEFLGGYQYDNHDDFITFDETNNIFSNDTISLKNLKFHTDWNWLMQVVEKIESLHSVNSVVIGKGHCFITFYEKYKNESKLFKSESQFANVELRKIEAVYNTCVEFIKWYNEQPK